MKPLCIFGVGSPFGDDQAGWRVIERLHALVDQNETIAKLVSLQTPSALLTLLEAEEHLVVVDACQGSGSSGEVQRFLWPDKRILKLRHALGHGMSLDEALQLAAAIGRAPATCEIWCVEGRNFEPGNAMSTGVAEACEQIAKELSNRIAERNICHA
jgi:hydrogenase maturation protease